MAEYYSVLRKAVGSLENNQADARRTVYDKARNALIGQLKAVDPPLTTAEISRQRLELEEAIRKVEREAVANPAPVRAPARAAPPPTPVRAPPPARAPAPVRMAPPPEPEPVEEPVDDGPSPQDVFRRAIQEAESRGNAAGAAAGAIERAAVAMRAEANQYGGTRDVATRAETSGRRASGRRRRCRFAAKSRRRMTTTTMTSVTTIRRPRHGSLPNTRRIGTIAPPSRRRWIAATAQTFRHGGSAATSRKTIARCSSARRGRLACLRLS